MSVSKGGARHHGVLVFAGGNWMVDGTNTEEAKKRQERKKEKKKE
jgi:hypothetical protein